MQRQQAALLPAQLLLGLGLFPDLAQSGGQAVWAMLMAASLLLLQALLPGIEGLEHDHRGLSAAQPQKLEAGLQAARVLLPLPGCHDSAQLHSAQSFLLLVRPSAGFVSALLQGCSEGLALA